MQRLKHLGPRALALGLPDEVVLRRRIVDLVQIPQSVVRSTYR
jgi:hypothetical protein